MDGETVVVAGAGLAGLVAARHLADAGADVTVFERRPEVGGRVRTQKRDGFTFDRGFQVLFTKYPAVRRELDLSALDVRYFAPGAVIARPGQRSTLSDPIRDPRATVASLQNDEVTTTDKLRTLALRQHVGSMTENEIFGSEDDSIRDYLREWGFSEDYIEHFVAPFYGGITLDRSLSTSKRVFEYTFKMLSEGSIGVPAGGMQAVPEQLAANARKAGARIVTESGVEHIDDNGDSATITTVEETVDADFVVVATDPKEARRLTDVNQIPTNARSCVTQSYRLPKGTKLETRKKLLLNAADDAPNTVVPMSEVAPEYAPDDAELVNATFLGTSALDRDASELAEMTRKTLESWYPDRMFDGLEPIHTDRIEFAQFDQPPGVHDALPTNREPGGRTYLAGDFTAWSSIQGAMQSGRNAAEAVRSDAE
ncbi:udp-galactopyranose mutase [Halogeometricum borinquense DSM 11551]|uniref:UDP-galactopyranose mutase n=1 Tax=Halogeometricum borinquense (strain ATCC 700274 / DSM 11551 / JCM 10706 / KCTC 4070 / PR3) TaxID=469382 RepID=E4NRB8_HALBP|nr:NAD(P)/FAD-dependent oxidoreductase [Halogeometricum borinquense]ADQ67959.1 UDP-galactopyranose mutase [Halogeometricum borinquense DSM 11551]ELY24121.1 udp-galactopyranose mutase [Halogeometricum borinquense DSM 11551]